MKKFLSILIAVAMIAGAFTIVSFANFANGDVFDVKDGVGTTAKYGHFELMYSPDSGNFWNEWGSKVTLPDASNKTYTYSGVSNWSFKVVGNDFCANTVNNTAIVKFTVPVSGSYSLALNVHGWNNAQGVISVVGNKAADDGKIWNDDYRPSSTSYSAANEKTYTWTLAEGDQIYVLFSYNTAEVTIDTLRFTLNKISGSTEPGIGDVYDIKTGAGSTASYNNFDLMYATDKTSVNTALNGKTLLPEAANNIYKYNSSWTFRIVNSDFCANTGTDAALIRFTAPVSGTYQTTFKAHNWDSVSGVVSTFGNLVSNNNSKLWRDDYRLTTTSASSAATQTLSFDLKKGDEIYWFIRDTGPITIDTLQVKLASHTHTNGVAVQENIVPAEVGKEGSYDEVIYCDGCSKEISRTTKTIDALSGNTLFFDFQDGTVGEYYSGSNLGYKDSGSNRIGVLGCGNKLMKFYSDSAENTTDGFIYLSSPFANVGRQFVAEFDYKVVQKGVKSFCIETKDTTGNWFVKAIPVSSGWAHYAMVIDGVNGTYEIYVNGSLSDSGSYDNSGTSDEPFKIGITDTAAQAFEIYVDNLKFTAGKTPAATASADNEPAHTPGDPVHENEKAAEIGVPGSYDEVVYCTVCGDELSREQKTIDALTEPVTEPVTEPATEPATEPVTDDPNPSTPTSDVFSIVAVVAVIAAAGVVFAVKRKHD